MALLVALFVVVLLVIYFWSLQERFRSLWAPEIHRYPILRYRTAGGKLYPEDIYAIDVYSDGAYFVFNMSYAKKQGKFDNYAFDRIKEFMNAVLSLPKGKYPYKPNPETYNVSVAVNEGGRARAISLDPSESSQWSPEIYTGMTMLGRLTSDLYPQTSS